MAWFIPYEQALQLKEIGYDEHPIGAYHTNDGMVEFTTDGPNRNSDISEVRRSNGVSCSAILWQDAFRWFRDKHGYYPLIEFNNGAKKWLSKYCNIDGSTRGISVRDSHEDAELDCLREFIELVKNHQHT
jgi:hypothetical protein